MEVGMQKIVSKEKQQRSFECGNHCDPKQSKLGVIQAEATQNAYL